CWLLVVVAFALATSNQQPATNEQMHATTHYSPMAMTYARALLELAGDQAGAIGEELGGLRQLIEENPTFDAYLADPGISETARAGVLDRTFRGKVSPLLWNFLGV